MKVISPKQHQIVLPPRTTYRRFYRSFVACAGMWIILLTGCGYSNESLHRTSVRTVFVDMFQSREFRRGIEFQLTEAVRKQIDRATPYRNAPRQKADTVLSGEVLDWREATLGKDFITNRARETAGTLVVRFRWKDMRTGRILVERPRFLTTVTYVRPTEESVFNARDDAVNRLARRIVEEMETPW
jgi:hypothetical protein